MNWVNWLHVLRFGAVVIGVVVLWIVQWCNRRKSEDDLRDD
jgi:hypothetical protein